MTRKEKKWQHWQEKIELIMRRPNNIKTVKSLGVSPVCMQMLLKYGRYCHNLSGCLSFRKIQTRKAGKARKYGTFGNT